MSVVHAEPMRRGRVSLEDQVGGLVAPERYDVRRTGSRRETDAPSAVPLPAPALTIRASRADARESSTAA